MTTALDPLRIAFERNPGALAHAVTLLRWWANDGSDNPEVIKIIRQSRDVARVLAQFDRAAKKRRMEAHS